MVNGGKATWRSVCPQTRRTGEAYNMILQAISFYAFAAVTVAAAVMVISARNPVHSVLFLILAFFNAAGLFVLMGAEFIAMILVIVYVGAVAVLFLFVVMMLDINFVELREGFLQYLPIGALVGLALLAELVLILGSWAFAPDTASRAACADAGDDGDHQHPCHRSGSLHRLHLSVSGGRPDPADCDDRRDRSDPAIARRVSNVKSISDQVTRTREESVEVRHVEPGSGV